MADMPVKKPAGNPAPKATVPASKPVGPTPTKSSVAPAQKTAASAKPVAPVQVRPAMPAKPAMPTRKPVPPAMSKTVGKSSQNKSVPPQEPEEDGRQSERMVRPAVPRAGFLNLKVKFILGITLTTTIVMAVVGFLIAKSSETAIAEEIDRGGVKLAKSLLLIPSEYWEAYHANTELGALWEFSRQAKGELAKAASYVRQAKQDEEYAKSLEKLAESLGSGASLGNPIAEMLTYRANDRAVNIDLDADVLEVLVYGKDEANPLFIASTGKTSGAVRVSEPAEWKDFMLPFFGEMKGVDNIQMGDGSVSGKQARVFKVSIKNSARTAVTGSIWIYLSKEKIAEASKKMYDIILLYGGIGLALGVVVAFGLGVVVARPVKQLIADIEVVASGKLDHATKAHSQDEIGVLASAFNKMTKSLRGAISERAEAMAQAQAIEHDLAIASEIQMQLLPSAIPTFKGYDVFAYYRPTKEVGGDYYDFLAVDNNLIGMVVADVSGKGIPGALVMTMARSLLRMASVRMASASSVLSRVNRSIARDIRRGMFVTCQYIVLDIGRGEFKVASAGHNPMMIVRAATGKAEKINPKGIALGFDKGPLFERTITEQVVQLNVGDRVVMYTDGIVEAMNKKREEYTTERFIAQIEKTYKMSSVDFIHALVADVDSHQDPSTQHDDMTVVTFMRTA